MGYSEREVWQMTPRKLLALQKEYFRITGISKEPEVQSLDDILP